MEARIHMGANRTGVQMSPFDTAAMVQGEDDLGVAKSDDRADLRVRSDYADEAEGLGDAELLDNAGWEMLIALARNCGHDAKARWLRAGRTRGSRAPHGGSRHRRTPDGE